MARYGRQVDWKKSVRGFTDALGYAGEHLTNWAKMWMSEAVQDSLSKIDADWDRHAEAKSKTGKRMSFGGSHFYPWYSGNLHDSVAGIVSDRHRTVAIHYMPEDADGVQTYGGLPIIGAEWAVRGSQEMQRVLHFYPGIAATVVVGVPYAEKVDQMPEHAGYVRELNNQFASNVEDYFTNRAGEYRTRVFVADNKKK